MLIYTVVYTEPSDRKHLILSAQTIMLLFLSSQLMLIHKKMSNPGKKLHFPYLAYAIDISTKKRCMYLLRTSSVEDGVIFLNKKDIIFSVPFCQELQNTNGM